MKICAALGVLFLIGASTPSPPSPTSRPCARWQQTATTQAAMNACSAQDAQRSGRAMTAAYLAYRDALAGGRRIALDKTQRAWAIYRDTYCAEKGAAVSGGSMQPLVVNSCLDLLNRRRARDLTSDRENP